MALSREEGGVCRREDRIVELGRYRLVDLHGRERSSVTVSTQDSEEEGGRTSSLSSSRTSLSSKYWSCALLDSLMLPRPRQTTHVGGGQGAGGASLRSSSGGGESARRTISARAQGPIRLGERLQREYVGRTSAFVEVPTAPESVVPRLELLVERALDEAVLALAVARRADRLLVRHRSEAIVVGSSDHERDEARDEQTEMRRAVAETTRWSSARAQQNWAAGRRACSYSSAVFESAHTPAREERVNSLAADAARRGGGRTSRS